MIHKVLRDIMLQTIHILAFCSDIVKVIGGATTGDRRSLPTDLFCGEGI